MPRFSHSLREQRRLWRLLGELAAGYWEHAADGRTPVVERGARPTPPPAGGAPPRPARARRPAGLLRLGGEPPLAREIRRLARTRPRRRPLDSDRRRVCPPARRPPRRDSPRPPCRPAPLRRG